MAKNKLIKDFIEEQINHLRDEQRFGTANNYEKTMRSFMNFIGNRPLTIKNMSKQLISEYNLYLVKRGLMRNSISFYMRNMRATYNKAAKQKIVKREELFTEVYTGIDKTRKRAVDENVIKKMYKLKLEQGSVLAFARDIFIFSYCMRGMSFVDIAYLRKSDIDGKVVRYCRRKTGQLLSVKIEESMRTIINSYNDESSIYVFPIIRSEDKGESYKQYRSAINIYNRLLKELSDRIGISDGLSSYTARHSWATEARRHNIPISVISAGMGHSSELITQIYLKSIEDDVVDNANAEIIGELTIDKEE